MATQDIQNILRLVSPIDTAQAQESDLRLVMRGKLSCFSYNSHDFISDEQETVSVEVGCFVATLYLTAVASAQIYRYDSALHRARRVGTIARVEFTAFDPSGRQLHHDTFIPGNDNGSDDFASHDEVWRTEAGSGNRLSLQRLVSDHFVEQAVEDSDVPVWEGKSISFSRAREPDVSCRHVSQATEEFFSRRKRQERGEGYFSYTHDFKGSIKEFHWVLMGLITDITPMLMSVPTSAVV